VNAVQLRSKIGTGGHFSPTGADPSSSRGTFHAHGTDLLSLPVPIRSSIPSAPSSIVEIGTCPFNYAENIPFPSVITI